jgi:hypothetical protein
MTRIGRPLSNWSFCALYVSGPDDDNREVIVTIDEMGIHLSAPPDVEPD